jgi:hypothetical protein
MRHCRLAFLFSLSVLAALGPAQVKSAKEPMVMEYDGSSRNPVITVLPVPDSLRGMKSVRFRFKAKSATAIGITLNETDGGRYTAVCWLPPDVWQRVELVPEDFILGQMANDPKDPDGKLDLDQVRGIAIVDVSQLLGAAMAATSAPVVVAERGERQKLMMDGFEVSTETPGWYKPREAYTIEKFAHPQLNWFTFGGADLALDTSRKVIAGNALQANYEQGESRFVTIVHALAPMTLNGATHLTFDVASDKDAELIFSLQEASQGKGDGPRYHVQVHVPGGGKAAHRQVAFSAFEIAEDSAPDPTGKLDLDKLRSIGIVDITGAISQQAGVVNTLRIGNVAAVKTTALPQ